MDYVLIMHAVQDYPAGKAIFDAAAGIRREAGERSYSVLVDILDAHCVVHFSQWTSIAQARTFFESARLVEPRRQAGVEAPQFHYLRQLDAGVL